ncbi:hypothetical protein CVU75_00805 [Candidatus Dependentiae bacterium HGW-Dependentiae-1]|nr:MAG: hypothetical protein CVU75_00805 [Candidatus Dependentiae bacterium HGW-Dependentiae-1]
MQHNKNCTLPILILALSIGSILGLAALFFHHYKQPTQAPSIQGIFLKAATGKSRLGDCLSMIHTCIYLSQKHHIPFVYYEPFQGSQSLYLSALKKQAAKSIEKNVEKVVRIFKESDINLKEKSVIYEIEHGFIKDTPTEKQLQSANQELATLIKPLKPMTIDTAPAGEKNKNSVTVALHVRKGGGFDRALLSQDGLNNSNTHRFTEKAPGYPLDASERAHYWINNRWHRLFAKFFFRYEDVFYPYKLPPDSFYVEQLKKIAALFPDKHIAAHLFTDDPHPEKLANKYRAVLNNPRITFSYREGENRHNKNVMDDFFAMTSFDCLIRPASAYSVNVQRISNFKVVISPTHGTWITKNHLVIDTVTIEGSAVA